MVQKSSSCKQVRESKSDSSAKKTNCDRNRHICDDLRILAMNEQNVRKWTINTGIFATYKAVQA